MTQKKIKCALIGPGNIGTDLLMKLQRSPAGACVDGRYRPRIRRSQARPRNGYQDHSRGVDGLLPFVKEDGIQIAFDATSAYVHAENSRKLNEPGRAG